MCNYVWECIVFGLLQNIRTDIVMDIGKSINPALDIGQVHVQMVKLSYTIEMKPLNSAKNMYFTMIHMICVCA